jgi:hypothetical protein
VKDNFFPVIPIFLPSYSFSPYFPTSLLILPGIHPSIQPTIELGMWQWGLITMRIILRWGQESPGFLLEEKKTLDITPPNQVKSKYVNLFEKFTSVPISFQEGTLYGPKRPS